MGTLSQTFVKCNDLNVVLSELKKHYRIGREVWHDDTKDWLFSDPPCTTIILSQNYHQDWVELEFDIGHNLYIYDEFLRRLSSTLNTVILLGYKQTTTGDGRIAKFYNGEMALSFYERYFYFKFHGDNSPPVSRIYVADNWGVLNSSLEEIRSTQVGIDSHILDYDYIYQYFRSEGLESDMHKNHMDWNYLHVEHIT